MHEDVKSRIIRAKELLKTAKHAAMATVNEDGSPHNTPFYLILDDQLRRVYFGSHPDSLHSQNVVRTGQLFVVVYDMIEKGGLYMRAVNGRQLSGQMLDEGLAVHNATRARDGKRAIERVLSRQQPATYVRCRPDSILGQCRRTRSRRIHSQRISLQDQPRGFIDVRLPVLQRSIHKEYGCN